MGVRTRGALACAGMVLAALLVPVPVSAAEPAPTRILIVGDSVAQGSAGDWTWRYRAWEALTGAGASVDFVGPRDDLYDNVADVHGSQAYPDPGFDRDHAARWGMTMSVPDVSMTDLVEEYEPDVVVETRGVNDLTHLADADELLGVLADEIAEAREADPDVDVVVAQLPQTWVGGVPAYNAALPGLAASLDDDRSHVTVAATGSGFTQGVDTWDPAHLTASGELLMAAGVVDALAALGVGAAYPRPLPPVSNGHWPAPTGVRAVAGYGHVQLTWTPAPGCPKVYIWRRDLAIGPDWERMDFPVSGSSWRIDLLTNGHTYDFRLQPVKGLAVGDTLSEAVSATPDDPPAAAPAGLAATPGPERLTVDWNAVPRATRYDVAWSGAGGSGSTSVAGPPFVIEGLQGGAAYQVTVAAHNAGGSGPAATVSATPSVRAPAAPAGVVAMPGPDQLRVEWEPVPGAMSYDVAWSGAGGDGLASVPAPPFVIAGLRGGQVYAVTVSARNAGGGGPGATVAGTPTLVPPPAPGPPAGLVARPGMHALDVGWSAVSGATSYRVSWADSRGRLVGERVVPGAPTGIQGLVAGERYTISVVALNATGAGPIASVVGVPRGPVVGAPARVRGTALGSRRARVSWRARPGATSYVVAVRERGRWVPVRTTTRTAVVLRGLPRGVVSVRVGSRHQLVAGRWSTAVRMRIR